MSRKSPVPDFEERQEEQQTVTQPVIRWIREYGFVIFATLLIAGGGIGGYYYWKVQKKQRINRMHSILGTTIFSSELSPQQKIKKLKPKESLFKQNKTVYPWFLLHLAGSYYEMQDYNGAIRELTKLHDLKNQNHKAVQDGKTFLKQIKHEKKRMENDLPEEKQKLKDEFHSKLMMYGLSEEDLPEVSEKEPQSKKEKMEEARQKMTGSGMK